MERCANCERQIGNLETPHVHGGNVVCGDCWSRLHPPSPPVAVATAISPMPAARLGRPVCPHCSGVMVAKTISSGNCAGLALALIVFCVGIILFIVLPVIGWVAGPVICLCALFMGGKRQKVLKCRNCGYAVDRA